MRSIRRIGAVALLAFALAGEASAQIFAAVLPSARSSVIGSPSTAFATISNTGASTVFNCRPQLPPTVTRLALTYQTTDASNAPTGAPNTPVDIPAGGKQGYVFGVTASTTGSGPIGMDLVCETTPGGALVKAPIESFVNDFQFSVDTTQGPDIIPIAVTPSGDGVLKIATVGGTQIMVAAAVNIGAPQTLTVTPAFLRFSPSLGSVRIVETDSLGNQLGTPASNLSVNFLTNVPHFFTIIVQGSAFNGVPFAPDTLRQLLAFIGSDGKTRGLTSTALDVAGPQVQGDLPIGIYNSVSRTTNPDGSRSILTGNFIVASPTEAISFSAGYFTQPDGSLGYIVSVAPYAVNISNGTISGVAQHVYRNESVNGLYLNGSLAMSGPYTTQTGIRYVYSGTDRNGAAYNGEAVTSYSSQNQSTLTISLASAAGSYTIQDPTATVSANVNVGSVNISGNSFSGTLNGCQLGGAISDPGIPNFLELTTLTLSGAGCTAFNGRGYVVATPTSNPILSSLGGTAGTYLTVAYFDAAGVSGGVYYLRKTP